MRGTPVLLFSSQHRLRGRANSTCERRRTSRVVFLSGGFGSASVVRPRRRKASAVADIYAEPRLRTVFALHPLHGVLHEFVRGVEIELLLDTGPIRFDDFDGQMQPLGNLASRVPWPVSSKTSNSWSLSTSRGDCITRCTSLTRSHMSPSPNGSTVAWQHAAIGAPRAVSAPVLSPGARCRGCEDSRPPRVRRRSRRGSPVRRLKKHRLLALASHGGNARSHEVPGDGTERVLGRVTCPVFLCRAFGMFLLALASDRGRRSFRRAREICRADGRRRASPLP